MIQQTVAALLLHHPSLCCIVVNLSPFPCSSLVIQLDAHQMTMRCLLHPLVSPGLCASLHQEIQLFIGFEEYVAQTADRQKLVVPKPYTV